MNWMNWARRGASPAGLIFAAICFGAALTPSLMPRQPIVQAALAGLAASFGYEFVLLLRSLWRYLEIPELKGRFRKIWPFAATGTCFLVIAYSLSKAASWQNATREAVGLPPLESAAPLFIAAVGLLIAFGLWLCLRGAAGFAGLLPQS